MSERIVECSTEREAKLLTALDQAMGKIAALKQQLEERTAELEVCKKIHESKIVAFKDFETEAAEAANKRLRAETIEECLHICDHAKLHYKGPVAMKIRREIAVLHSRARASQTGGGDNA